MPTPVTGPADPGHRACRPPSRHLPTPVEGPVEPEPAPADHPLARCRPRAPHLTTLRSNLDRDITAYRDTFDALLREQAETTDAIRTREGLMAKVVTWRSRMISMARQAPAVRRTVLLQTAGFGLGSPRTVKDMKDFLVEVKARVDLHGDSFRKLGAMDAVLTFPARVLQDLERASGALVTGTAPANTDFPG